MLLWSKLRRFGASRDNMHQCEAPFPGTLGQWLLVLPVGVWSARVLLALHAFPEQSEETQKAAFWVRN